VISDSFTPVSKVEIRIPGLGNPIIWVIIDLESFTSEIPRSLLFYLKSSWFAHSAALRVSSIHNAGNRHYVYLESLQVIARYSKLRHKPGSACLYVPIACDLSCIVLVRRRDARMGVEGAIENVRGVVVEQKAASTQHGVQIVPFNARSIASPAHSR
jgi:hypothetical protein